MRTNPSLFQRMGVPGATLLSLVPMFVVLRFSTTAVAVSPVRTAVANRQSRQMAADCTDLVQCLGKEPYSTCSGRFPGCQLSQEQLQAAADKIAELESQSGVQAFWFWCYPKECDSGTTCRFLTA